MMTASTDVLHDRPSQHFHHFHHSHPFRQVLGTTLAVLLTAMFSPGSSADAGLPPTTSMDAVDKHVFEMSHYTTQGGDTIAPVRVGWEAYGELNDAADNAILITHFFSGTSHAAGRYSGEDVAGYWDAIIGPGKPLDTNRYFVVSSDTLVNLNAGDPRVTTTGPASLNPATGEPWGTTFPLVGIGDFVNVQKALMDELGIQRLHAVMGASMGALQAYEWASAYPDRVDRLIAVIGAGVADPWLIASLDAWAAPIRLDPNWRDGDYYDDDRPPIDGLRESLKLITLQANHWRWADATFDRDWADPLASPEDDLAADFEVVATLDEIAAARASKADANHLLYLVRANQNFVTGTEGDAESGLAAIKAPTLLLYSADDLVFPAENVLDTARMIQADGTPVTLHTLKGDRGHLDGVVSIEQAADQLRGFLEAPVR